MEMKNLYSILGVNSNSTTDDIKKAYRKLAPKFHPDHNSGDKFFEDKFKELQNAYQILIDPSLRKKYDSEFVKGNKEDTNFNYEPRIVIFKADKDRIEYGETIEFKWTTVNCNDIRIEPFGLVSNQGTKSYKVLNFDCPKLVFKLIVKNTHNGAIASQIIEVENLTYSKLKNEILAENSTKSITKTQKISLIASYIIFFVFSFLTTIVITQELCLKWGGFCLTDSVSCTWWIWVLLFSIFIYIGYLINRITKQ